MAIDKTTSTDMDVYISSFPHEIKERLEKIRRTIRAAAPEAKETIKYGIPTFTLNGNLVSFAAYKKHIGLYPAPKGTEEFNKELSAYGSEKSTVRFPLDKPIPQDLIRRIVNLRVKDMAQRAEAKGKKRRSKAPAAAKRELHRQGERIDDKAGSAAGSNRSKRLP